LPFMRKGSSKQCLTSSFWWKGSTILLVSCLSLCNTSTVTSFIPSSQSLIAKNTGDWKESAIDPTRKLKVTIGLERYSGTRLDVKKKRAMPIVGYNAKDICDYYDRRPLVVGWRLNGLSLPLLGMLNQYLHVMLLYNMRVL